MRKEGLDFVGDVVKKSDGRIKPSLGDLMPALKARLSDSNKNLVMQTLEICSSIAVGVGQSFDRYSKILLPGAINCLCDNKPQVRQSALGFLDSLVKAIQFNPMLPALTAALASDSPHLKKELLTWMLKVQPDSDCDLSSLITPMLNLLQDRSLDVRKCAQLMLPVLIDNCGFQKIQSKCAELRGPAATQILQLVESHRADSQNNNRQIINEQLQKPSAKETSDASVAVVRKRPDTAKTPLPAVASIETDENRPAVNNSSQAVIFLPCDSTKAKLKRSELDRGAFKWGFDSQPRKELVDFLREQMEVVCQESFIKLLFSKDHSKERDYMSALGALLDWMSAESTLSADEVKARTIGNSDLILKYLTVRLFDSNTTIILKTLEVAEVLLGFLEQAGYLLQDYEATCLFPCILAKVR